MSSQKKESETGWFYHAPYKAQQNTEPVGVPPASQIPGLSDLSLEPEPEQKKMWIRETDSKYIVLAKQGGRPDLLRFRDPKPQSDEPQGYPRCDWYYHDTGDNNQQQQNAANEPYEFMLPDYMVHKHWDADKRRGVEGSAGSRRAPYGYNKDNIYTDDPSPSDKTVKLPEIQPSGYGVRAHRLEGKNVKHAPIQRTQPVRPKAEGEQDKLKYEPMPQQTEDARPPMGKLLSHGYVSEWETDRDSWYSKQQRNQAKYDAQHSNQGDRKVQSEYQESMRGRQGSGQRPRPTGQPTATHNSAQGSAHSRSHRHTNQESDPGLFKLSKFKNVAPKTESRRTYQQSHGHGDNPITHVSRQDSGYQHSMVTPVAT